MKNMTGRAEIIAASVTCAAMLAGGCAAPVNDERIVSNISLAASESGGTYSGAFSASSGQPQLMSVASGALSGSSIMIPAGALTIDLSISVSSSTSLATTAQAGDLGISGVTLSAAGPAVNFAPSSDVELSQPMLLSIPLLSSSLWLDGSDENVVVIYKAISIKNGATEILSGLIPRSELVVAGNVVKFKTMRFGAFQVVKTSTKVESAISKPSSDKIGEMPGADLVGSWKDCHVEIEDTGTGSVGQTYRYAYRVEIFVMNSDGTFTHQMLRSMSISGTSTLPADCSGFYEQDMSAFRQNMTGKFFGGAILDSVTVPSGASGKARELDFSVSTITFTPLHESIVMTLNGAQVFDRACDVEWRLSTSVDLTDSACVYGVLDPDPDHERMAVGDKYLTLYAIGKDSAGVRQLYLSEDEDQATRPTGFGDALRAIPEVK